MMAIDVLQQARDANPVGRSPEPPPIASLRACLDAERERQRRRWWRHRRVTVAAATTAAATAAITAFVLGAGSDPRATAAPVRSGGLLLGEYFAAFRAPADGDDAANPFAKQAHGAFTVDPASARRLTVPGPAALWVAASDQRVCISARSILEPSAARGACARPTQILDNGLFVSGRPSPAHVKAAGIPADTTEIAGLLPDGVDNVTFTLADGSHRDAAVIDNGVELTVAARPLRVSFRDRNNAAHTQRM